MTTSDQKPDTDELERAAEQLEAPLASLVGDYEESQADNPDRQRASFYCRTYLRLARCSVAFTPSLRACKATFTPGLSRSLLQWFSTGWTGASPA